MMVVQNPDAGPLTHLSITIPEKIPLQVALISSGQLPSPTASEVSRCCHRHIAIMAGSQLKRLKASLKEQGIVGPQQSKKQRRKNAEEGKARNDKRLQRGVVLDGIREQFNPFDLKHAARGPKFEVTTNRVATGDAAKGIRGRPGVTRAMGEERVSP